MSKPAIEAKSLSSLTTLASNPPSYPRNPTHIRHESLVLYIARVPGSRDVFLSPMKPREKVVTAEDIQNSLYFVHVDNPEDIRLVEPPPTFREPDYQQQQQQHPASTNQLPTAAVQRKAVPGAPASGAIAAASRRKPLPRTLAPPSDFEDRQNTNAANYSQTSPNLLGPDYTPRRSFDSLTYRTENDRPPPSRRPSEQTFSSGASLTLIRRDPASGAQWNVARIEDPQALDVSSSTLNDPSPKTATGAPLFIEVTNPGYSKFLRSEAPGIPSLVSRDSNLSVLSSNQAGDVRVNAPPAAQGNTERDGGVFRRRLWMEGAKNTSGSFSHRRLNSYDSNMSTSGPQNSFESWPREQSSMDLRPPPASPFHSQENFSYNTNQMSEKQSSFRGYVFTSPWNGRCEFVTGAGGGSLKCQHLVPGLQGAPPVSMPVSELRFNLPSSSKMATPRGEDSSRRSSFFHRPRHSRNNSSVSNSRGENVEDTRSSFDRMDLTLGQEFAGGGFGGKQAKLGKLIIEDEGLKMVDLLVAANLALWWRAYERVSS